MATSSAELARAALDGLLDAGTAFGLLHGRHLVEGNQAFSDVDLVVGEPPASLVMRTFDSWATRGLTPILLWPYSVGGSASVFLSNADASGGVQLDMLYDVNGRDVYGVRSGELLAHVSHVERYPEVDEPAALVYLWQKRLVKGEADRLAAVVERARDWPRDNLEVAANRITGSGLLARVAYDGEPIPRIRPRWSIADLVRLAGRVRHPIGAWVHARDASIGEALADRLSAILVVVRSGPVPARAVPWWYMYRVAPVLRRPGAYVSWGGSPSWGVIHPDAVADGDASEAAKMMVSAMSAKVVRCVS